MISYSLFFHLLYCMHRFFNRICVALHIVWSRLPEWSFFFIYGPEQPGSRRQHIYPEYAVEKRRWGKPRNKRKSPDAVHV